MMLAGDKKNTFCVQKSIKTKYHKISTIISCLTYAHLNKIYLFYDIKICKNVC